MSNLVETANGASIGALADRRLMPTYRRLAVTFVRGEGMHLYDDRGRKYLDFVAGVAVNALGHSHPAVTEALSRQAALLVHTSNLYYTEPAAILADKLCRLLGWQDGRVFFANSGAEALECAIKLTRKWAHRHLAADRQEIIAAEGSFHGRTLGALAATGQPAKWKGFEPLPAGFRHVAFGQASAAAAAAGHSGAAILVEPVQAEAGVIVPPEDYLGALRSICDEHGLILIADEVQTGIGRTGTWFASLTDDCIPDVVTLAKGLGGGFPIGACIARGPIAETFEPGDHATTLGGGPLACTVAMTVLQTIEQEGLIANAGKQGVYLLERLRTLAERHDAIAEVRGKGLMVGIRLAGDFARSVVTGALEEGLLVNDVTASVLRLTPALITREAEIDEAVGVIEAVLGRIQQ